MDSEKITKLSLEQPDPETGFQALVTDTSGVETSFSSQSDASSTSDGFGLPDHFWSWMSGDAGLKREFDKMIEGRVAEGIVERFESLKADVAKEAEAAGLKKGIEQSATLIEELKVQLERICESVVADKVAILKAHERQWIRTFSHLLRRFLVPRSSLACEEIGRWLTESIGAFEVEGKIKIYVSSGEYTQLSEVLKAANDARWEVTEDPQLKPGELHCACDDGGVLFSSQDELKKLESWIERFTVGGESA